MAVKIEMDMPKSCGECRLCDFVENSGFGSDFCICVPNKKYLGIDFLQKRHPDCPLKELSFSDFEKVFELWRKNEGKPLKEIVE